jgi:nitrogen regulatory protein P-II 1
VNKITAIIKPFKFVEVSEALRELGISGVIVTEVQGIGRQLGHHELYSGTPYASALLPKVMIEIVSSRDMTDQAVQAIRVSAQTGRIGDGKIFVSRVDEVLRIRTGEAGAAAI